MLGLTRRGEYAIRGMLFLARKPKNVFVPLSEIARTIDAPASFCAKIFQSLCRSGLLVSSRGAGGGLKLGKKGDRISLLELVESIEGPIVINECLAGSGTCSHTGTCKVHRVWRAVQEDMVKKLDGILIADLF